jgi:hypothetical protein
MRHESLEGDIEHERLDFHRRDWLVQRAGWSVMALIVAGGLVGLFGSGPLAHATAGRRGSVWLEYERFARLEGLHRLTVHLDDDAGPEAEREVALTKDYLEAVTIEHIDPEPVHVTATADALVYRFAIARQHRVAIRFDVRTSRFGSLHGTVRSGNAAVAFRQLVYP